MVDTDTIRQLVPHYVVMLVVVFAVVGVVRALLGEVRLLLEFAVVLVTVFLYPFAVRRLGYAPSVWQE
ncbi:MAG: hypothetical protein ABEH61_05075 [Haloarculaceae archaeon]